MSKRGVLFLSLLVLFSSLSAHAFILIRNGAYQKGERPVSNALMWTGRTLTLRVNTDQTVYGGSIVPELTTGQFQSALTAAAATWNSLCGSDVRVVIAGTTTNTKNSGDSVNSVSWDNRTTGEGNQIASTGTLAVAYSSASNATLLYSDCDIVVNGEATGNFGVDGGATTYDLQGILTHEIGHCLGLDHSIEPPTFTSNNSILLTATMAAAVSAGDLGPRTLSQDEIDGMECVNSANYSARAGYFCTSYHGSSGGGALSGTVSGGPTAERTCGDGQSAAITASTGSGGGCATRALAADEEGRPEPYTFGWELFVGVFLLLRFLYRRSRRLLFLLPFFFLIPKYAAAELETSYQYTWAKPALVNSASAFTSAEGTFSRTEAEPRESYTTFADLFFALSGNAGPHSRYGAYYRSLGERTVGLKGYNSSDVRLLTKTSTLKGWLAGAVGRWSYDPDTSKTTNFFFELEVGLGKSYYRQTLVDNANSTSTLDASAFAFETNAFLGAKLPFYSFIDLVLKVGYTRMQSNYYVIDSVAGSRYAGIRAGDRMALRNNGGDVRLVRHGLAVQAGMLFDL
ncbi:MAG TPA: hypothetical protein VIH99_05385 [Bdellovibrionota bacterium]